MKKVGIWMDREKALIVSIKDEGETLETIRSNVDFFNPKGGSRSKTRWGPQQVVHDSKYLEREKHQMKSYFDHLAETIKNADAIALFGPADTAEKFRKELSENYKHLRDRIRAVEKADSMTDNQVKALVRDFYKTSK